MTPAPPSGPPSPPPAPSPQPQPSQPRLHRLTAECRGRAPGHAPVASACGLAGGTPWSKPVAEEGVYQTTPHAHHGMNGSDLPEMPTGVVWERSVGEAVVAWQIRYNHGGG